MLNRIEVNRKARTVVDITGMAMVTIPTGTEFVVTWYAESGSHSRPSSVCKGLDISFVYNDEFEFIGDGNA